MQFLPFPQETLLKCYLVALKQQESTYIKEIQKKPLFQQTSRYIEPKVNNPHL